MKIDQKRAPNRPFSRNPSHSFNMRKCLLLALFLVNQSYFWFSRGTTHLPNWTHVSNWPKPVRRYVDRKSLMNQTHRKVVTAVLAAPLCTLHCGNPPNRKKKDDFIAIAAAASHDEYLCTNFFRTNLRSREPIQSQTDGPAYRDRLNR